jgi:hypothetical protein
MSRQDLTTDLPSSAREDYAKLHANTSGPSHQGQTSQQAQQALDEIDRLRSAARFGVNIDTIEYAIRYCMTRRTYALIDGFNLAEVHWPQLSKATRSDVVERFQTMDVNTYGPWPTIAKAATRS